MTNDELQSQTISFLRFPLIVGVVLIHTEIAGVVIDGASLTSSGGYPLYTHFSYLFSQIIARIAVPLFFFFSGFLFFYKADSFGPETYLWKLRKRIRTLLVPYVIWNLLFVIFYLLQERFGLTSVVHKSVADYSLSDWLWTLYDTGMINPESGAGYPFNYPLWFIRDLMVVVVCSPLIYFATKRMRFVFAAILGVLWFGRWWFDVTGFSIVAFFFFSIGAYFSIHKKNFVSALKPLLLPSLLLYALIATVELACKDQEWTQILDIHGIGILTGMIVAITLTAHYIDKGSWRANDFLSRSSFFVYAIHVKPLLFLIKICVKILRPDADWMLLVLYVLCPTLIIIVGVVLYGLLKRYLPKLTAVVTGDR